MLLLNLRGEMTIFLAHYWYYRPLPANITFLLCYRLNFVPPPNSYCWSPSHQCDSIWRQGLQRVKVKRDHKGDPSSNRTSVLIGRGQNTRRAVSIHRGEVRRGHTEMWPSTSQEGRPWEKPTCWHLDLGLQLLGLWRDNFLKLKSPNMPYSIMAARAD